MIHFCLRNVVSGAWRKKINNIASALTVARIVLMVSLHLMYQIVKYAIVVTYYNHSYDHHTQKYNVYRNLCYLKGYRSLFLVQQHGSDTGI